MNGSCGRMGYRVEWYHESLGGIIAAVPLLTSKALEAAGLLHAFPERGATDAELARELGLPRRRRDRAGEAGARRRRDRGERRSGARGRSADALVGARRPGGRSPWACAWPTACPCSSPTRRAETSRPSTPAGAGSSPGSCERASSGSPRTVCAAATRGSSRRSGRASGRAASRWGATSREQIARASHGAHVVAAERGDKAYVDLRAAVRAQLVAAGRRRDARIEDVPGCTKHETGRFHSFRRDGANSGRMLAAIATRDRSP